jgi:hypothetical protein
MYWRGFTDKELSMMATHLANGGSLCCEENAGVRMAITKSTRKQDKIYDFAYGRLGCGFGLADRRYFPDNLTWGEHYLNRFLESL